MSDNKSGDSNSNKSEKNYSREIVLAKWDDRFVAWLIDFVILSIIINILFYVFSAEYSFPFWGIYIDAENGVGIKQPLEYIIGSSVFFLYWVILEFLSGQTIGKRVVHIKTTNLFCERPNIVNIDIEVFGKSFLLPIDIILGLIFSSKRRQRIFNKVSGTIVIKLKKTEDDENDSIKYIKDY
jgi:uncharacterized RDD family membrane protein YckC